jgi:hypothetical protein
MSNLWLFSPWKLKLGPVMQNCNQNHNFFDILRLGGVRSYILPDSCLIITRFRAKYCPEIGDYVPNSSLVFRQRCSYTSNIVREQNPAKPAHDEQNSLICHFKVFVVGEYCLPNIYPANAAHDKQNPLKGTWVIDCIITVLFTVNKCF